MIDRLFFDREFIHRNETWQRGLEIPPSMDEILDEFPIKTYGKTSILWFPPCFPGISY
jgi:hypothetical protein